MKHITDAMKFPMIQIVIIVKVNTFNKHFYLRVRLEKKMVRTNTLLSKLTSVMIYSIDLSSRSDKLTQYLASSLR